MTYYRPIIVFLIFGIAAPVLNAMGLLSDTTLNLWGRYFCFAIAALGIDLIWGYTGILSLCQAFFFCLGGYAIGMHMLLKTGTQGVYGSALPDFMCGTAWSNCRFFGSLFTLLHLRLYWRL